VADVVEQTDPYDLTVWQGKTWLLDLAVHETVTNENGSAVIGDPIPLDGYSARGQIRSYPGGPLLADLATSIDAAAGGISLSLSPSQTRRITTRAVYDLELVSGSNVVGILHGDVVPIAEVTLP
jgi:hypothetical protein